jgi:hypothetical protein|tara:strand:+ start:501 stop:1694 length:1194 start_codon:yes stop_codon:yes gene_type:complete
MASTWGNNTWGSNEWADDTVTAIVSGQEATISLGSSTVFNGQIIQPTESQLTASLGSISINSEVTLTGIELTSSLGDSVEFNETGWGRISWGLADWGEGADETISVTGLGITASPGSITTGIGVLLEMIGSNHSMTTSVGSPEVFGELGVPLTGVSATFATPTLSYAGTLVGWGRDGWGDLSWGESPNQVIGLVGQEIESNLGSPTLEFAYELSSQVATTSVGSLSFVISPTVAVSGQVATSDEGVLGLNFGVSTEPITGIASTSTLGTVGLEFGPSAITGVSATSSVGDLTIASIELINATGVSATSSIGSVTLEFAYELSGQSSTSNVGSFSTIPDVVQGLVTDSITSTVGEPFILHYQDVDTGSNTSYTGVATGSNSSYSSVATGSNTSYTEAA